MFLMITAGQLYISGPQKGPAERGHVKKRQETSKVVKKCQKYFRHFSTFFAQGKQRQKSSKSVKNIPSFFDNFRAAPVFRPLWGPLIIAKPEGTSHRSSVCARSGASHVPLLPNGNSTSGTVEQQQPQAINRPDPLEDLQQAP